jgi:site-specific recombinase XerD
LKYKKVRKLEGGKILRNEIVCNQTIKNWLSGSSKNTKNVYTDAMRAYTEFLDKTPEQILVESEEDIRLGKLMRERRIFDELREFREFLESTGIASLTIRSRITGVRSFFTFYNIQLPILPRYTKKARPQLKNRDIPTKEDIQEIISIADPLEKAIILIGVSSGLAVNEISNLKVQEFLDGYDPETQITTLHLIREKVDYEFYTFFTPEASRAIWKYIEYRNRTSENKDVYRQNQLLKQRVEYDKRGKATGYIFICRAVPSKYIETRKTNVREAEEIRKLDTHTIQKIYRELNERAIKSSPYGERNLVRSHNLRKFFNSTLLANGCDIFTTDFLMGHKIDSTRDAYFRADPKALREKYENYIPYLTIQKELNVAESPEFQKLKSENEVLARETAKATVERAEIQKLRSELEENKIRMIEIERDAYIRPYKVEIDDLKYNLQESKKIVQDITVSKEEQKAEVNKMLKWNGKIKYLETQISQITFEYKIKIDDLKNN